MMEDVRVFSDPRIPEHGTLKYRAWHWCAMPGSAGMFTSACFKKSFRSGGTQSSVGRPAAQRGVSLTYTGTLWLCGSDSVSLQYGKSHHVATRLFACAADGWWQVSG